jgi:hypothetical protein
VFNHCDMLLIYKNRGILIPVFAMVSVLSTVLIITSLARNEGGIFLNINLNMSAGVGFIIAATWTYLVKDEYYKDAEGNKIMMDTENSFFFISMKYWALIFLIAGLLFIGNSFLHLI